MKIFISYAKNGTRDLALQLRQALESQDGITAWMDDSLLAGANWKRQIQDEIKRCDLVIVLLSPDVNRETEPNSFVLNEIGYAQQLEKPLLPVLAQHTELPIDFANTHYVDLTQSGASVDAVVDAVRSRITPPANPFPVNAEGEEQHLTRTQRHTRVQPTSQSQSVFNPATGEDELVPRIDFSLFSPVKIDETGFVQVGELPRVEDILSPPFEWCAIPAGRVEVKDENSDHGWFDVTAFQIAKYPITNTQYALFVEAGGYRERKWWTKSGWQRREGGWTQPLYWDDSKWNGAEYPVVGVSWYEAVAFCQWLSEVCGESVILPTEAQWQRAAQGDDERVYPWGNESDSTRCNTEENGLGKTTPVTQYPNGTSPYGVLDMSGNVFEWCLNLYSDPKFSDLADDVSRVARGGTWSGRIHIARCSWRVGLDPYDRAHNFGFRVMRASTVS